MLHNGHCIWWIMSASCICDGSNRLVLAEICQMNKLKLFLWITTSFIYCSIGVAEMYEMKIDWTDSVQLNMMIEHRDVDMVHSGCKHT